MKERLRELLNELGVENTELFYTLAVIGLIAVVSLMVHLVLHRGLLRLLARFSPSRPKGAATFFDRRLAARLALAVQGVLVYAMARAFLASDGWILELVETLTNLWIVLFGVLALFSLLDGFERLGQRTEASRRIPLRGLFQGVKLVAAILGFVIAVAFLIGKSPLILFSGLGAMTAVVLLVFRDPILGLVAGIQLSANNMLSVGDWLQMDDYGADGDVIDISLTTVKVRNWDKTITSIPNYALISDSFKNWRNIELVGGRRMKRSIRLDASCVGFATEDDLERLRDAQLLTDYIEEKVEELGRDNQERGVDPESITDARRLTNIGLLRAYLTEYLGAHEKIRSDLTYMVRQLQASDDGIPLELYGFCTETSWVPYETVQADIFDHVYSVLPAFGLRLHQAPTGHDVRDVGRALAAAGEKPREGENENTESD